MDTAGGALFALMGFVVVVVSAYQLAAIPHYKHSGIRTTGRVVRVDFDSNQEVYDMVVQYQLGEQVFETTQSSGRVPYIGQQVPVYYLPDHPEEGVVIKPHYIWVALAMLIFGLLFVAAGIAVMLR